MGGRLRSLASCAPALAGAAAGECRQADTDGRSFFLLSCSLRLASCFLV